jgi:acyl-CoA thioester hydrolase
MEADGILSPVMDIQASYKTPVRYGDKVKIKTWIEKYDGLRVVYGYEIVNGKNEVAATGHSSHVCVKKESFRPISIKRMYPEWHEAYEKNKKQDELV